MKNKSHSKQIHFIRKTESLVSEHSFHPDPFSVLRFLSVDSNLVIKSFEDAFNNKIKWIDGRSPSFVVSEDSGSRVVTAINPLQDSPTFHNDKSLRSVIASAPIEQRIQELTDSYLRNDYFLEKVDSAKIALQQSKQLGYLAYDYTVTPDIETDRDTLISVAKGYNYNLQKLILSFARCANRASGAVLRFKRMTRPFEACQNASDPVSRVSRSNSHLLRASNFYGQEEFIEIYEHHPKIFAHSGQESRIRNLAIHALLANYKTFTRNIVEGNDLNQPIGVSDSRFHQSFDLREFVMFSRGQDSVDSRGEFIFTFAILPNRIVKSHRFNWFKEAA